MRGGGGAVVAPPPPFFGTGFRKRPFTLEPMSSSELDLRAGDDERQAAVDRLVEHYRAGRLTSEELEERTAAANAARTRGDLALIEADLPAPPAPEQEPRQVAERRRHRREHVVSYLAVISFLWIIWAATGADYPWPIWPMAGWGLALVLDLWGGGRGRHGLGHLPPLPPARLPPGARRRPRRRP